MADTFEIPIKRRHYAGTAALEAGGLGLQHWAYDETNEYIGIRLSDGTYRYHSRSKLFPPGAGTTAKLYVDANGYVFAPSLKGVCSQTGLYSVLYNTTTKELTFYDSVLA